MANNGYQMLIDKMKHRPIKIPPNLTDEELRMWFLGYQACMDQITHIIEESNSSLMRR